MGDNNLDDLILTEPESESSSNRGLLVILGLVVLLLILGVVLANIIFGGGSDENATAEDIKSESAQVLNSNDNGQKLLIESNKSELAQNGTAQNDNLDADLAPLDDKDNLVNNDMANENSVNVKNEEPKDGLDEKIATTATAAATAVAAAKTVEKKKEPKKVQHVVKKPKKVQHKIKHIVSNKAKSKSKVNNVNYGGNIYIQVGSFSKGPSADFINKIRSAGLKYRIKEVNGFRRVLIGPFKSSSDAQRVLGTVKSKISSSAFIKR